MFQMHQPSSMIRILYLGIGIALVLMSCGQESGQPETGGGSPEESDRVRIMFVNPWVGHEVWNAVADGARDAAAEFDVNLRIVGPPEGYSETTIMLSHIEAAVVQQYDGVLCHPYIPETFEPVIRQARAAGVHVVCIADDTPESGREAIILTDDIAAAKAAAETALKALDGRPARIGMLSATPGVPALDLRLEVFREAMEQAPGTEIIGVEYGYSDYMQNIAKVQAQLIAHPEINLLYGSGGDHPPSHARVVKEMGRAGEILIIGFDDLEETLDYIREGVVYATISQNQYMWGYLGVKYLAMLSRGESVPEFTNPSFIVITKENVDNYRSETRSM